MIEYLNLDEKEAIDAYEKFLSQEPHSKKTISEIKKIIIDEKRHIKIFYKL
jgi:rubrerythrin